MNANKFFSQDIALAEMVEEHGTLTIRRKDKTVRASVERLYAQTIVRVILLSTVNYQVIMTDNGYAVLQEMRTKAKEALGPDATAYDLIVHEEANHAGELARIRKQLIEGIASARVADTGAKRKAAMLELKTVAELLLKLME